MALRYIWNVQTVYWKLWAWSFLRREVLANIPILYLTSRRNMHLAFEPWFLQWSEADNVLYLIKAFSRSLGLTQMRKLPSFFFTATIELTQSDGWSKRLTSTPTFANCARRGCGTFLFKMYDRMHIRPHFHVTWFSETIKTCNYIWIFCFVMNIRLQKCVDFDALLVISVLERTWQSSILCKLIKLLYWVQVYWMLHR